MIESFSVPKDKVAEWAGFTSAVFSLSQAATGVFWGIASDRYGRKPVILLGLLCTMLACLLFGFSRSLPEAIAARAFSGSMNGNVGIIRTTVAELVPQKNLQPTAFSIMPLVWTIGTIIGPALGGVLANPVASYPRFFRNIGFFTTYPYALPNMVAGLFFLVGMLTGFLFLRETLENKKHGHDHGRALGKFLLRCFKRDKKQDQWYYENGQMASLLQNQAASPFSITDECQNDPSKLEVAQQAPPGYREVSLGK